MPESEPNSQDKISIVSNSRQDTLSTHQTETVATTDTMPASTRRGLSRSWLLTASIALFLIDGLLYLMAENTTSYDTANSLSTATLFVGGLAALLFGAGSLQLTLYNTRPSSPAYATSLSRTIRAIMALLSLLFGGIIGLAIALFIAASTADRACQLSSSKCY